MSITVAPRMFVAINRVLAAMESDTRKQAAIDAGHPEWADLPASAKAAKAHGTSIYFTGKQCSGGHVGLRQSCDSRCITCERAYWQKPSVKAANRQRSATPEFRVRNRAYEQQRRARMTEEEKVAEKAAERARRAAMTPDRRKEIGAREYAARLDRLAKMTPVRRISSALWSGISRRAFDNLDEETLSKIVSASKGFCPCCGVELLLKGGASSPTLDHLIPTAREVFNARLLCAECNRIKQNALPWHLHRVADWMTKEPTEMLAFARTLPEMPRHRVDGRDRWMGMLRTKRGNAKKYGVEFSLSLHDVSFSASCPVLQVPFLLLGSEESAEAIREAGVRSRSFWNTPSFDRIDPKQGYVPGNVVLVSVLANTIMNNCTSPDRVRIVADWFDRELAAAPELAALIDYDAQAHWKIAAE